MSCQTAFHNYSQLASVLKALTLHPLLPSGLWLGELMVKDKLAKERHNQLNGYGEQNSDNVTEIWGMLMLGSDN